jgi:hypothetical protein
MTIETFMRVSKLLVGDPRLPDALGELLLTELARVHGTALDALDAIDSPSVPPHLRSLAADLVLTWLFGVPYRDGNGGAAQGDAAALWFQGRFYQTVGAHVPALPGGYFGHWMYPGDES